MFVDTCLSAIDASQVYNESGNPAQFSIDLLRADCAMFESLVNLDIAHALNESGQLIISESELRIMAEGAASGIINKIKELIAKAKHYIEGFIISISNKIKTIFDKDRKLYKRYEADFNKVVNNISTYKSKDNTTEMVFPNYEALDFILNFQESICGNVVELAEKMYKSTNEERAKIVENFKKDCETSVKNVEEKATTIQHKVDQGLLSALTNDIIGRIRENIKQGKDKRIKTIKAWGNSEIGYLDKIEKSNRMTAASIEKDMTLYNSIFSLISTAQQTINKITSYQIHAVKTEYKLERKLFVQVAKFANAKSDDNDAKNESALNFEIWAIGEASDDYIEEAFLSLF